MKSIRRSFAMAFAVLTICIVSVPLPAQTVTAPLNLRQDNASTPVKLPDTPHGGEFVVTLNKSQLLQVNRDFTEVTIGNPEIADVVPLTKRMVYVLGKSLGSTNLAFIGTGGTVIAVVDLVVSFDIEGLKAKLFELMPDERIEVRTAGRSILLSGQISSPSRLDSALSVAQRFAPQSVTNLMTVGGDQQVMLQVRFAEVQRTVVKDPGFNNAFIGDFGSVALSLLTGGGINPLAFAVGGVLLEIGDVTIESVFDALEEKGLVRTLAEPNLIVLSGDTANFLAGGEFPIPVAQDSSTGFAAITIEFKEFGVSLAFSPTVIDDQRINLVLRTEVSAIDPTVSVTTSNITVPGLTVRRANTTVEMGDGESFAIAGLLQDSFRDKVDQFPWAGDVPVLGTLFRSTDFQSNQTELVIIITPRMVRPVLAGMLRTPADAVTLPTESDLFLRGSTEGPLSKTSHVLGSSSGGGIEGEHGYIVK